MYRYLLLASVFCLVFLGCDSNDNQTQSGEIVVESYLIANENLGQVRISRSARVDQTYDFTRNAVPNANVTVTLLDENGAPERVYEYFTESDEPGIYKPVTVARILPGRTYRLDVDILGSLEDVSSETTVPGAFELLEANASIIQYQGEEQLELELTRSVTPGRQSVFIFSTESLQPEAEFLTPFYRDLIGDSEDDIEDLRITESPIINEGNYDINPGGTITVRLPWLAVAFLGPNRLTANALDDNLYDFIRTQSVQQGGSTLSPGEIPNVIDHIDGGTGIFGSLARSTYDVLIIL